MENDHRILIRKIRLNRDKSQTCLWQAKQTQTNPKKVTITKIGHWQSSKVQRKYTVGRWVSSGGNPTLVMQENCMYISKDLFDHRRQHM